MKPTLQYRDLGLRIAFAVTGAFIVTRFGGNDPLLVLLLTKDFYIEFGVTLVITFLVVQMVYWSTTALDRHFGWHARPLARIPLQVAFGILLPSVVTFLIAALYFAYYGANILDTNYHLYALPFIVALISIFNLYYYIRYLLAERSFYRQLSLQQTASYPKNEENPAGNPTGDRELYVARTLTRSVPVPLADIAYFYRSNGHVYLRQFSGKDLLLSQSLDAIETELDEKSFFRVARHFITHRNAVVKYDRLSTGQYLLTLDPAFREEITVSKTQARSFKSWITA